MVMPVEHLTSCMKGRLVRKPSDKSHCYDDHDIPIHPKRDDEESARLVTFPLRLVQTEDEGGQPFGKARPYDVAEYIAEMLQSLESLAQQNRLDILGLMIAMAREQANDDVRETKPR